MPRAAMVGLTGAGGLVQAPQIRRSHVWPGRPLQHAGVHGAALDAAAIPPGTGVDDPVVAAQATREMVWLRRTRSEPSRCPVIRS